MTSCGTSTARSRSAPSSSTAQTPHPPALPLSGKGALPPGRWALGAAGHVPSGPASSALSGKAVASAGVNGKPRTHPFGARPAACAPLRLPCGVGRARPLTPSVAMRTSAEAAAISPPNRLLVPRPLRRPTNHIAQVLDGGASHSCVAPCLFLWRFSRRRDADPC
jgi:hypothetical protein